MLTPIKQINASSITSVISSIQNDRQVFSWFSMLVSIPEVQQTLATQDKLSLEYLAIKKIQTTAIITYLAGTLLVLEACLLQQPWILCGTILPIAILILLSRSKRLRVSIISKEFILKNIPSEKLNQQTLYQICENLAKKYNIPSLVDIITNQDFIRRKILLAGIPLIFFTCAFKTWQAGIIIFVILAITTVVINTSSHLRKLK